MTGSDATLATLSGAFTQAAERLPTLFDLAESELRLLSDLEAAYTAESPSPSDPRYEVALEEQQEAVARLAQQFVGNEAMVIRKVESYIGLLAHMRMLTDARKAQAARLTAKAKVTERGEEWLRERLLQAMRVMGRERIETPIGTVRIQANPGRVEVLEEQLIPPEFVKTVITTAVDKRAISAWIKSTSEVPDGVEFVKSDRLAIS